MSLSVVQALQTLTKAQSQQFKSALALFNKGAFGDALAVTRRLAEEAPYAADVFHLAALCLLRSGDPESAEQHFRRAIQLAPDHPHALANLATLLRRLRRPEEAVGLWRRAVTVAPTHAQAWLDLGLTELELGRWSQARTALERATTLLPTSSTAWHGLGAACRASDDLEVAEAALRKAISIDPRLATAWVNLGAVLRLLGRPAQAVECYERALGCGGDSPELGDALAGALLDLGHVEDAILRAREVTRRYPQFVPGHVTLAHLLWEHEELPAAEEHPLANFEAAVRAQPKNYGLQLAFIRFLIEAQQADHALARIHEVEVRTGGSAALIRLKADALERLGRFEEAGALYAGLYRHQKQDPALLNAYTRYLLKAGRWDIAASRATEAVAGDPRNQEAWAYLGTAWRLLGDSREAWLCDYDRFIGVVDIEPPAGYRNLEAFLAELLEVLEPLHRAAHEPIHQSLRGGSQTPGRLFGRPSRVIAAAEQVLRRAVEQWLATLPTDAAHPFLRHRKDSVRFVGSWSVKLKSSGQHVNHIHPQGWLSSAFYVAIPPAVRTPSSDAPNAGYIQFGQPPVELGLDLAPRHVLQPKAGRLTLFPSYLWHGTVPFEDAEPRVTLAFDARPIPER